jgi:hypothetical protein
MADVTISETCCHLEAATGKCLVSGRNCPFAADAHRTCDEAGFVAEVKLAPDEFKVIVDRHDVPKEGPLVVRKCQENYLYRSAGVYVNNVIGSIEDDAKLEIDFRGHERVELVCRTAEVGLVWKNGKFSPL